MPSERTTEELFADLSPQVRAEAINLAGRLQLDHQETEEVVAAVREAGIDERYLRQAVEKLGQKPDKTISFPAPAAALGTLLFLFAQGYAAAQLWKGEAGSNVWIPMFLAAALGALLPRSRNRWLAPAVTLSTWLVFSIFFSVISTATNDARDMAPTYAVRTAAAEAALAFFSAFIANGFWSLAERSPIRTNRRSF